MEPRVRGLHRQAFPTYIVEGVRNVFWFPLWLHLLMSITEYGISRIELGSDHGLLGKRMWRVECMKRPQKQPFGVIPKDNTGKWKLIPDISAPEGTSVNDGINPYLCLFAHLMEVEDAAKEVSDQGWGPYWRKWTSRVHIAPSQAVHTQDQWLLGMKWREH